MAITSEERSDKMTKQELIQKMEDAITDHMKPFDFDLDDPDISEIFPCEIIHKIFDDLLLEYINDPEVTKVYNKLPKDCE